MPAKPRLTVTVWPDTADSVAVTVATPPFSANREGLDVHLSAAEPEIVGYSYAAVERPLVRVLARMEEAGVRVDLEFLRELSVELTKECGELEAKIHATAGERFNVNSTPQLRTILFEKLGLTPVKKTKTGPGARITVKSA